MRNLFRNLSFFIYKQFKLFWIIFAFIVLLICTRINWHNNVKNSEIFATDVANKLSHNVDSFIDYMFQDAYLIPVYKEKNLICSSHFIPYLQHIIMNHPEVSAMAILDSSNQMICSTLPDNKTFLLGKHSPLSFMGPFQVPIFNHPIYAVQKKIGPYQVEVIVFSSVFEKKLHIPVNSISSITLYDQHQNKNIIQIENKIKQTWLQNKLMHTQESITPEHVSATAKLNNLDGLFINVVAGRQNIISNLWYNQILISLNVLVIFIILYYLIKNLFVRHYSLYGAIKNAIKYKQFYPMYQPVFDVKTNAYTGAETLLRWQNSENELIMPDFFIQEAENTGLIIPITLQIIERAFQETKLILNITPSFHLSFNLCALHFTDPEFFNQFYKLVGLYSIPSTQIILEITERDLLDEQNDIYLTKMLELRKAGYSLALDDYGTGHSGIKYLHHFPFNYLKIDKIFIQAIGTNAITETLNDAIINLAKKINLTIIAEGVETKEQVNYLQQSEVQLLQGWYFSKALSASQLIRLLKGAKNDR